MALSTNLISGLSSGFDWRSMIDQLMAVEHRPVDLVTAKKTDTEAKLKEWQTANSKLLAFKTAAAGLKDPDIFQVFAATMSTNSSTVKASDLLSAFHHGHGNARYLQSQGHEPRPGAEALLQSFHQPDHGSWK